MRARNASAVFSHTHTHTLGIAGRKSGGGSSSTHAHRKKAPSTLELTAFWLGERSLVTRRFGGQVRAASYALWNGAVGRVTTVFSALDDQEQQDQQDQQDQQGPAAEATENRERPLGSAAACACIDVVSSTGRETHWLAGRALVCIAIRSHYRQRGKWQLSQPATTGALCV